jgi:hypothetical protein
MQEFARREGMSMHAHAARFDQAIGAAVAWLRAAQRPSGELPTLTARRADMADARAHACCVYTTTYVVHALRHVAGDPAADAVRAAAGAFLRAERNADGSWSYEGRGTTRVPPDLDDTACAAAALLTLGERPGLELFRLLWENEAAPGGPYYTWVGVNQTPGHLLAGHCDALVNANVLLCAGLAGISLPGAAAYLADVVERGDLAGASDYCPEPHLLVYAIARAAIDGAVADLAPVLPALRTYALQLPAPPVERQPFRLACLAAALLALGDRRAAEPYLTALPAAQQPDGSWPAAAAYSGYPPWFDGAPALTTAIALDALGRGR